MAASFLGGATSDIGALLSSLPRCAWRSRLPLRAGARPPDAERPLPLSAARADRRRDGRSWTRSRACASTWRRRNPGRLNIADAPGPHHRAFRGAAALCRGARCGEAVGRRLRGRARPRASGRQRSDAATTVRAGVAARAWSSDNFGRHRLMVAGASGALAASMPRSSSGSSGFSGGGGSGRGGGGGGGGGW